MGDRQTEAIRARSGVPVHRGSDLGVPHPLLLHGNASADSAYGEVETDEIGCGRLESGTSTQRQVIRQVIVASA
jgi:hypothetical protein